MTDRGRAAEGFSFGRRWERSPRRLFYALPQAPRHAPRHVPPRRGGGPPRPQLPSGRPRPRTAPPCALGGWRLGVRPSRAATRGRGVFLGFPAPRKNLNKSSNGPLLFPPAYGIILSFLARERPARGTHRKPKKGK